MTAATATICGDKIMHQSTPPWKQHPLDKWSIELMQHSLIDGIKYLFVAMKDEKGNQIMSLEPDDREIWNRLYSKAMEFEA